MFTPLILFFGLTVATAVIAHWSDNLGKKLGKKRVSLFGLRPRTTATILTIASSWAIMLFTLAVLLIAVPPLKNALFSYDRERAQAQLDRRKADQQIEAAKKRLETTQFQFDAATTQLNQARQSVKNADSAVKNSRIALGNAQKAETRGLQRARQARRGEIAARRGEKAAQIGARKARQQVAQAQQRVGVAQKRVAAAQTRFVKAQKSFALAQRETRLARRETQVVRRLTASANRELKSSSANLRSARANLKATRFELKNTQQGLKNASESYARANRAAFDKAKEVIALERQRNALQNLAAATSPFVGNDAPIKVGQTFAARIVAAPQTPASIAAQLRDLVKQGQESFAESEDTSPTPKFPAGATLQLLPLSEPDASGKPVPLEGEALLQRLARDIAASRQTTSIRLVAPRNFLSGETRIEAIFVAVEIKPAFAAGETLASSTIDGAQGDALIFNSLLELTNLGRSEAEKRGVNPPQSPDEPNFYASGTNIRLFEALRLIESSKARLRVNLIASKALSTVEPLQVRFEIENGAAGAASS